MRRCCRSRQPPSAGASRGRRRLLLDNVIAAEQRDGTGLGDDGGEYGGRMWLHPRWRTAQTVGNYNAVRPSLQREIGSSVRNLLYGQTLNNESQVIHCIVI